MAASRVCRTEHGDCPQPSPGSPQSVAAPAVVTVLRPRRALFSFLRSVMAGVLLEELFELAFLKVPFLQVILHTCDVLISGYKFPRCTKCPFHHAQFISDISH